MAKIKHADPESVAQQIKIREKLDRGGLMATGFHFCLACQRITEPMAADRHICCFCHSSNIRFEPASV